jgi:hypothetical protein
VSGELGVGGLRVAGYESLGMWDSNTFYVETGFTCIAGTDKRRIAF